MVNKALYGFITVCFLMFAWVVLSLVFDKDYPITEDAERITVRVR